MSDAFYYTASMGFEEGMKALRKLKEDCDRYITAGRCNGCKTPHRANHRTTCPVRIFNPL